MSDIIDRAQQYDEIFRQSAIAVHFAERMADNAVPATRDCIDCGERIDKARRVAVPSAVRCVGCQGKHERTFGRPS